MKIPHRIRAVNRVVAEVETVTDRDDLAAIGDIKIDGTQMVYPNPVTDQLHVDLSALMSGPVSAAFELFNYSGQKVLHRQLHASYSVINLSNTGLKDGVYLYRLTFGTGDNRLVSGRIMLRIKRD